FVRGGQGWDRLATGERFPASTLTQPPPSPLRSGRRTLVPFHQELLDAGDHDETQRALGVSLCRDGVDGARAALPLLEGALRAHPEDVPAWEAKGFALVRLGRYQGARDAFRMALTREPNRESALVGAAALAAQLDRRQEAITFWRHAIAINPWRSDYHAELALAAFKDRNWRAAAEACREALRLNPFAVEVRKQLLECELHLGNIEA